jgi:leucyl/phenylalanyl-tRNA--protein transferase
MIRPFIVDTQRLLPSIPWLDGDDPFPPIDQALTSPNGLLAAGGDLSVDRLLSAYSRGIFPWFNDGEPVLWWSPDPRMALFVDEIRESRSLARQIRRSTWRVSADTAFDDVVSGCAAPRAVGSGTWIVPEMRTAYEALAAHGAAHSIEVWDGEKLVGGLYGVAVGRMFFGESMFSRESGASKVALLRLTHQLARWDFQLIDCEMSTPHLASLGARELPRAEFFDYVRRLVECPGVPGPWTLDRDLGRDGHGSKGSVSTIR